MPDSLQIDVPDKPKAAAGRSWVAWMGAATIALALVIVMWPGGERQRAALSLESHLPFGPAEQAYAPELKIENLALSRAENFLNQEVTTLAGQITNGGVAPIANVELTVEFSDELGQVVLRESCAVIPSQAAPFRPGERRAFEVSFEHIPSSWNIQQPAVRVSGIAFTPNK